MTSVIGVCEIGSPSQFRSSQPRVPYASRVECVRKVPHHRRDVWLRSHRPGRGGTGCAPSSQTLRARRLACGVADGGVFCPVGETVSVSGVSDSTMGAISAVCSPPDSAWPRPGLQVSSCRRRAGARSSWDSVGLRLDRRGRRMLVGRIRGRPRRDRGYGRRAFFGILVFVDSLIAKTGHRPAEDGFLRVCASGGAILGVSNRPPVSVWSATATAPLLLQTMRPIESAQTPAAARRCVVTMIPPSSKSLPDSAGYCRTDLPLPTRNRVPEAGPNPADFAWRRSARGVSPTRPSPIAVEQTESDRSTPVQPRHQRFSRLAT